LRRRQGRIVGARETRQEDGLRGGRNPTHDPLADALRVRRQQAVGPRDDRGVAMVNRPRFERRAVLAHRTDRAQVAYDFSKAPRNDGDQPGVVTRHVGKLVRRVREEAKAHGHSFALGELTLGFGDEAGGRDRERRVLGETLRERDVVLVEKRGLSTVSG